MNKRIHTTDTSRNSEIGRLIRQTRERYTLSEEVARKFMLAGALEPLADKPGCTTRFVDLKDSKNLELFVAAAINSGFAVKRFVDHLIEKKTMVGAYQFLIEAVIASKFNRYYGKINEGILEAGWPIIAGQIIFYEEIKNNPYDVLPRASELLKKTSPADVLNLIRAKELSNQISGVADKYPVRRHDVDAVFDYYRAEVEAESKGDALTEVLHNRQFIDGFTDIGEMLKVINQQPAGRLIDKTVPAYNYVREKYHDKIGVGLAADFCAICLYLYIALFEHREAIG